MGKILIETKSKNNDKWSKNVFLPEWNGKNSKPVYNMIVEFDYVKWFLLFFTNALFPMDR